MSSDQLYESLKLYANPVEARQVALKYLEDTKVRPDGFVRILDMDTLRWMPEFTANGNKYYIISPEDGCSLRRYTEIRQALAVVFSGFTPADYIRMIDDALGYVNLIGTKEQKTSELALLLNNMKQAAAGARVEWPKVAWAATYFILRENEDVATYDKKLAQAKMDDWAAENIDCFNLFFCCLLWENKHNEQLNGFVARLTT